MAVFLSFTVGMWTLFFCLFQNEHQALTFVHLSNSPHPNLSFTIEKEHMKKLPFWMFSTIVHTD